MQHLICPRCAEPLNAPDSRIVVVCRHCGASAHRDDAAAQLPDGANVEPTIDAAGIAPAIPKPKNPWPFIGLLVLLCVAGWFLVQWMADSTRIQDCVMSGKKNCAPMDPQLGR